MIAKQHTVQKISQCLRLATLATALSVIVFIYLPAQIFLYNASEFHFPYSDAARWLYLPALGVVVTAAVLGLILPRRPARVAGAILAVLFLGVFVQSGLLSWDYGSLDGRLEFTWSDYRGWIDILAWTVIALGIWRYYKHLETPVLWLAVMGTIVLLLAARNDQIQIRENENQTGFDWKRYTLDPEPAFLFSASRNIVLVVLDEVQNDIAWDVVRSQPDLREQFEGFTWYRNATSGFGQTAASIPNILTGMPFENDRSFSEYRTLAYRDTQSLLMELSRLDWQAHLHPMGSKEMLLPDKDLISNMTRATFRPAISGATLLDYSLFRSAPHALKNWLYHSGDWFLHQRKRDVFFPQKEGVGSDHFSDDHRTYIGRDDRFREQVAEDFRLNEGEPIFKLYHLMGAHAPWDVPEQHSWMANWLQVDDAAVASAYLPRFQGDYDTQAKAYRKKVRFALESALVLVRQLKESSIYDATTIFIVGDHGAGRNDLLSSPLHPHDGSEQDFSGFHDDLARAIPLFLVKPAGSSGPLVFSDEPIQNEDISMLLRAELDGNLERALEEVFERNRREGRYYRHYKSSRIHQEFLREFRVYRNVGHSWIADDWRAVTEPAP